MARQMIQDSMRRPGKPAHEERRAEPPVPSLLFLALQPRLLGRMG
jgi:hypothetical protein